ncbi:bifunctional diguanylate cyclase/phosphodiesterase [Roseibium sp. MMSF_3544]|uniref:putative bifunctional diguanylate cyclase/phosphodiesterase n=1 Tax=unclassified Roseibium TaxID=2629323 RepID=UPI00273FF716|nr:GGDEF domain-containing protein [Roseibium sp. MMSF_3544]
MSAKKRLGLHSLAIRISAVFVALVLCGIGLISTIGYSEISKTSSENTAERVDRAARTAAAMLTFGTGQLLKTNFDATGQPVSLQLTEDAPERELKTDARLHQLVRAIGDSNGGAARLFIWSDADQSFEAVTPNLPGSDEALTNDINIHAGHAAYTDLSGGVPYLGSIPMAGRSRLAVFLPIVNTDGNLFGAIEANVGWLDELMVAENRHHVRIVSATILIVAGVILLGGLFLRFELRPLRQLAGAADKLASGTQPGKIPHTGRGDEIGDLANGLERVTDLQDKLHKLAYTDPVTTAGNRRRYFSDLKTILRKANQDQISASLLHIDFTGFSKVNDTFGQQIGNRVLILSYTRLAKVFGPTALIARISADDFCILLPNDGNGSLAKNRAIKAIETLSEPFVLAEGEIRVEPSIGVALLPRDAQDAETAHRVAGLALRAAKEKESHRYEFFSAPLNERVQTEMLTETLLRSALKTRQLKLHYQPQICPVSQRLIGLEALVRWPSETRGFIPPSEFIPVAEKTGLILELGHYVLQEACAQIASWISKGFEFDQVSVNVSPLQFRQPRFAEDVQDVLETYGVPPHKLCLEVTENVFVDTSEQLVLDILSALQKIGVQLSLDDFGSGYSSLIYLHRLPFQELKIDRVFISKADEDQQKEQLFQAIVGLGQSLGLRVIAEGAETAGELSLAATRGCSGVQGFFYSPAVPPEQLLDKLGEISTGKRRAQVNGLDSRA